MHHTFLKMFTVIKSFMAQNDGQSMAEYAMAVGLIAFGCIAGEAAIATNVNHVFVSVATTITTGVLR